MRGLLGPFQLGISSFRGRLLLVGLLATLPILLWVWPSFQGSMAFGITAILECWALLMGIDLAIRGEASELVEEMSGGSVRPEGERAGIPEELRPVHLALERLKERDSDSAAQRKKLDEMKADFVSTVSHELRTPLTAIHGYTQLLLQGDAGETSELQKEFLKILSDNTARLSALIDDVLDFERLEIGGIAIHKSRTDLRAVLGQCVRDLAPAAAKKDLALKLVADDGEIPLAGDAARLTQVFMNLLSNAIKYTAQGSVTVEAEIRKFVVTVHVRDTGMGLSTEEQAGLFTKFYRTRSAIESGQGGTGLGLVITKGLIEAHGGKLTVSSRKGEGSVFSVALPTGVLDAANEVPLPAGAGSAPSGRIWLLDPDSGSSLRIKNVIEGSALGVVLSFSSETEIPEVADVWPSLVLVSAVGVDAITVLRSRIPKGVPVLYLSDATDPATAFEQGASAFLPKPFENDRLLAVVRDLLRLKGGRILLADSNTDLRLLIKRSLEQTGFEVDDVERGTAVLRRLEKEKYDLALLGFNFLDVSGRDLMKLIRKNSASRDLAVFAMLDDQGAAVPSREKLVSLGADQFVGKHHGIGGIVDAVCEFMKDRGAGSAHG